MAKNAAPGRSTLIVTVLADSDSNAQFTSRLALQVVGLSLAGDGARVARSEYARLTSRSKPRPA
jgi:hypothetical protein